jgi:predicted transcriptional regulator
MSTKTHTQPPYRAQRLRAVPESTTTTSSPSATTRTAAEEKLWQALHANPNSTAAALADAANIGKSTTGKILAKWANSGTVTRTPGIAEGGRRAPDRWAIADGHTEPTEAGSDAAGTEATGANTAQITTVHAELRDGESPDAEPADVEAAADASDLTPAVPTSEDPGARSEGAGTATDGGAGEKAARLAPGALRGMVEDYLRDHPGEQFSPNAIGKALNRSAGAVNNALEKLISTGTAVKTQEAPKRFALAPSEQEAATQSSR